MELDVSRVKKSMTEQALSQTELAKRSGLSRARVTAILKEEFAEVRRATEGKLASALRLHSGALVRDAVENEYRAAVADAQQALDFTGLGMIHYSDQMPLERGFAPLMVRERLDSADCRPSRRRAARATRRPDRYSLQAAVARSARFFLLGNPGSGKTTALRYVARRCALAEEDEQFALPEPLCPVMVRLAEWATHLQADEEVDVIDAGLAHLDVRDPVATRSWLRKQAEAGRLLLLLDGLDEVADPEHQVPLLEKIRSFLRDHPDVRVVITARTVGFETPNLGGRFDEVFLEALDTEAIRGFATEWSTFRHGHESTRKCRECGRKLEELRHAIVDHPRVRELAGNPLMLTILLLLHEAGAALPQRRCQLYEKVSEALLFSWQERKCAGGCGAPDRMLKLDDREVLWLLESIALEMQQRDWTLAPRWWLAEQIRSFLCNELHFGGNEAQQEADGLIWSLHHRAGLLVERGPERFGFMHLAFQEYFAARALVATRDPVGQIERYVYHPRWREVVRLLSAQLDRRRAPQLVRSLLDDPDPTGRFLRRGLLITLQCLADGAPVHDAGLLEQIADGVAGVGSLNWLGLGLDTIDALAELRSSRLKDFAVSAVQRMLEAACDELEAWEFHQLALRATSHGLGPPGIEEVAPQERPEVSAKPILEYSLRDDQGSILVAEFRDRFDAKWADRVLDQLRTDSSGQVRETCAEVLSRFIASHAKVRRALLRAFEREQNVSVREAMVRALSVAVGTNTSVREKLVHALDHDPAPEARAACAMGLGSAACVTTAVREKLVALLTSQSDAVVRAGAARGLGQCAVRRNGLRDRLLGIMRDSSEDERVRVACLRALEDVLPPIPDAIRTLVGILHSRENAMLVRVAAQVLAEYAATGRVDWTALPIERIEHVLVAINDPCPCALDALRGLVDAREVRRQGMPLEKRIGRVLSDLVDQAKTIFVFGSTARRDQRSDSDIDLLVLGDLTLKQLAPRLRRIEQDLGRQVNAVVYSEEEWTRRCHDRNPFVMQVLKGEKVFVTGGQDELAAMV